MLTAAEGRGPGVGPRRGAEARPAPARPRLSSRGGAGRAPRRASGHRTQPALAPYGGVAVRGPLPSATITA